MMTENLSTNMLYTSTTARGRKGETNFPDSDYEKF